MKTLAAIIVLAVLALAGCGDDSEPTTPASDPGETDTGAAMEQPAADGPEEQEQERPSRPPGSKVKTGSSQFGEVLFDGDGQAIYYFAAEQEGESECYGECASEWPPVLTKGRPRAGGDVEAKKLGTTKRRDGKLQVTYAGRPLYLYAHEAPGEVRCHNVSGFGDLWLAVQPNGDPVP